MMMSDSISCLYVSPSNLTIQFPSDETYYHDLKRHLEKNKDYREERIRYRNNNPKIKFEDQAYYFFQEYTSHFHSDIKQFALSYPTMNSRELTQRICSEWAGYSNVYGFELIERALNQLT